VRVFVTGATGFIGHHLCRRLRERGDEVVALVRSPSKIARLPEGVEPFRGDLSTFADPSTVFPRCDVVVHLAGCRRRGQARGLRRVQSPRRRGSTRLPHAAELRPEALRLRVVARGGRAIRAGAALDGGRCAIADRALRRGQGEGREGRPGRAISYDVVPAPHRPRAR